MPNSTPSIGVLRAQIRAIRDKVPNAKVFGIMSLTRWLGPEMHGTGSDQIAVFQCDSPLQMRLALQSIPDAASAAVLITPLDQSRISDDILVRLALRRLEPLKSWEIVRSLFKAKQLDPRVTRHHFLAEMLLEYASSREIQPVAGGLLDADTVWSLLLEEKLKLPSARPDLIALLRAGAEFELADRWKGCDADFRSAAAAWLSEVAGDVANGLLQCLDGEHGEQILGIGLSMGVVYHDSVGHELDKAAGRLEGYIGTTRLPTEIARRWRDAAAATLPQLSKPAARRCLDDAEGILEHIGATSHAWRSNELESGFEQRMTRLGQALASHVDARATSISDELRNQHSSLQQHRLGRVGGRRMDRVAMAIRLARWLADQNTGNQQSPSGLSSLSRKYADVGGFVDWARRVLRGGEPNKDLAGAYVRLVDRVTELRETENQRFGRTLSDQHAIGDVASGLVPVESILDQVVAKAAQVAPVLLLVVDGMSWAVFRELASDIQAHDWIELGFGATPKRLIGLAAVPSVTEACRTSLFCGALKRGQAYDEVQGFSGHQALVAHSQAGLAPKLFHKASLEGDEDSSLAGDIRQALANKKQRVVGIVINAVDDHLDKGDQIDAIWTTQHIRVLEPILAEAAAAGRLVVLLSDHGHILDRQTEGRPPTDGLRWRKAGGPLSNGEVEIKSPRVILPADGHVVVPWTEKLRYGPKKNGYHGGVTPQEMLIPIGMFWPELGPPDGLTELPVDLPTWWTEPTVTQAAAPKAESPSRPKKEKAQPPTLFDKIEPPVALPTADEAWIKALLKSEMFATQKQMAGRARIDDALIQRLLSTLARRGGSMTGPAIASAIEVPEHRLPGLLAVIQRVLNVEGYAILDRQEAANTVVLNIPLLKKQFELGT